MYLTSLSANAVMEIRKCSRAKGSSWLLIGSWIEVTVTSRFLSPPGGRSSRDLMLSSPVTPTSAFRNTLNPRMTHVPSLLEGNVTLHETKASADQLLPLGFCPPFSFCRSRDPEATRERQDTGFHSISACAGATCGLL